jgi:hypothetical protein
MKIKAVIVNQDNIQTEWVKRFPTKEGFYWFVGERYKRNSYCIERGDPQEIEIKFCEVHKISNGVMVMDGQTFMFESELGEEWYFAEVDLPGLPDFKKGSTFRGLLKSFYRIAKES